MQDRFKFRVWSKANNKYCHHITTDLSADGLLRVLRPLEKSEYIDDWEHQYDIQQCTGIKDKNGKLIYEGDIVYKKGSKDYQKNKLYSKIVYDEMYGHFDLSDENGIHNIPMNRENIEVVGNIYENPELIRG